MSRRGPVAQVGDPIWLIETDFGDGEYVTRAYTSEAGFKAGLRTLDQRIEGDRISQRYGHNGPIRRRTFKMTRPAWEEIVCPPS